MKKPKTPPFRFKTIHPSKLISPEHLTQNIRNVLVAQIPAMVDPCDLTLDALRLLSMQAPPVVRITKQGYEVVANFRVAQCLRALPPKEKIVALVLVGDSNDSEIDLVLVSAFLSAMTFALDASHADNAVYAIWEALNKKDKAFLSPKLVSKTGFSELTGINRRIRRPEQDWVQSPFNFEEEKISEGEDDGEEG